MISGVKISQLPVLTNIQPTDFFLVRRGNTTGQTSQLTLANALTAQNIGTGSGVLSESESGNGVISFKRIETTGGYLTIQDTNDTITLSSGIPENGITDTMILEITSTGKVYPQAINTDNSLSGQVLFSQGPGEVAIWKDVPIDATSENIPNKAVERDSNGDFYASTIFAALSGNADTSTKWLSSRVFELNGPILGTGVIDGTEDIIITTTISAETITDFHISESAGISDSKLNPITTPQKVSPNAIDYFGTQPGDVLTSTGSATIWQNASALNINIPNNSITNLKLDFQAVTEDKIADNAITTLKLSAEVVTTSKIASGAVTTEKILDDAVTLEKTTATPVALESSLVSRDEYGNLSAAEITADLKGNATTSNSWSSPMTLELAGDLEGFVSFNGSQTVTLNAGFRSAPQSWVVFNGVQSDNLSGIYIQSDGSNGPGTQVTIYQTISTTKLTEFVGSFTQEGDPEVFISLPISAQPVQLTEDNIEQFLTYNFLTGSVLTAEGFDIPDGPYTVEEVGYDTEKQTIEITILSPEQPITVQNIVIKFDEVIPIPPHSHIIGHVVNAEFLAGESLDSDPFTLPPSGLYTVTDVIDANTLALNTSISQYASGQIILHRREIEAHSEIPVVTYVGTGNYILNFETEFEHPFYYGLVGSVIDVAPTPVMTSVQRLETDYSNQLNTQFRTLLFDNGGLIPRDFRRTQTICFGNRPSQ